tara:strand:+ start:2519 stop:4051 length:1533 start_codon:yes stop_codon:yes gene_type:complete
MNKFYYPASYLVLFFFSFFINFYYSNFGIEPMDSFVLFNGGFKVLNGLTPFKDYWLVTGPLMDYLNALFFLIFDVNWISYTIHSSLINTIISIIVFILFINLKLDKIFSFFYALMFSILMYPNVGVPFVDHHATIFVLLSFCLFILGVLKNNNKYFFFIPLFLLAGFLCKQTPTTYGVFALLLLGFIYLFYVKNTKNFILSVLSGSVCAVFIVLTFFFFTKIPISNFLTQYIFFASSIGDYRLSNWKLDLFGVVHEFKFILIPLLYIFYLNIISYKNKKKDNFIVLLSISLFSILMLFHQSLTMNENYIFFLIPILTAFIHVYKKNIKNVFLFSIIFLCLFSVIKYHLRYNEHRKFHRLEKVDLSKAIEAEKISQNLKGLKWITATYKDQPSKEIQIILESINLLKKEEGKFSIITDYLFIPAVLNMNDYSPNQWYHPGVSFPLQDSEYFEEYKTFFVEKLQREGISKIIIVGNGLEDLLLLTFDEKCISKSQIGQITFRLDIQNNCKEF